MEALATIRVLAPLLLLASSTRVAALDELPLHTRGVWSLQEVGNSNAVWNVTPPTTALEVIAGEMGVDPLYRYGESNFSGLPLVDWFWNCSFEAEEGLLKSNNRVLLRFNAIDSVAGITLNNAPLGSATNAHRAHTFDASGKLLPGTNTLSLLLPSPVRFAAQQAAAYPYPVPATQQKGALPHYNFIRKAASDFGWDWGPAFAPSGVTGGVWLRGSSAPFLAGVGARQEHLPNGSIAVTAEAYLQPGFDPGEGLLTAVISNSNGDQLWRGHAWVEVPGCGAGSGRGIRASHPEPTLESRRFPQHPDPRVDGAGDGGSAAAEGEGQGVGLPLGSCGEAGSGAAADLGAVKRSVRVMVHPPYLLWWPHDLGGQPLYTLRLAFDPGGSSSGGEGDAAEGSSLTRRIGFRTVELVRDPLSLPGGREGESFRFRVNGLPLYARGANVIPQDVAETRVGGRELRRLVADARAAHMNMLRVWGGGRYFQDAFYDACDEAGVLVWQEAMFACGMYPRDAPFLEEVSREVSHQAIRLSPHPCLVLWGGNNENEASFGWFPETRANPQLYAVDYSRLFVDTVREALLAFDPGMIYLDSSPSNGLVSTQPYAKRWGDVSSPDYGDVHFYDYRRNSLDPHTYPPAKFVSEFGFMSFPSMSVYATVTEPEDWALDSEMTEFRMRRADGVKELMVHLRTHWIRDRPPPPPLDPPLEAHMLEQSLPPPLTAPLPLPPPAPPTPRDQFEAFMYITQVQQAAVYETAVSQWRRLKSHPAALNGGVLYWQMNDIWQGPSWSGINYGGKWKLLHHAARRFFQPMAVSGLLEGSRRPSAAGAGAGGTAAAEEGSGEGGGPGWVAEDGWVEVHLVNDLSVEVEGSFSINAIPFDAAAPSDIVPLSDAPALSAPAFSGGQVWNASVPLWLLPTLRNATGRQQLSPRDFMLRLTFCPTHIYPSPRRHHHNPFLPPPSSPLRLPPGWTTRAGPGAGPGGGGGAASDGSATTAAADRCPEGDPLAAGSLAVPPSGWGGAAAGAAPAAGDAAAETPDGHAVRAARCAARRRLLQCSQSFLLLADPKEAALGEGGEVVVLGVEWAEVAGGVDRDSAPGPQLPPLHLPEDGETLQEEAEEGSAPEEPFPGVQLPPQQQAVLESLREGRRDGSGTDALIAVRLGVSRPFLPLYVTLDTAVGGEFLENGVHLLPWEPSVVYFLVEEGAGCTPGGDRSGRGAGADAKEGRSLGVESSAEAGGLEGDVEGRAPSQHGGTGAGEGRKKKEKGREGEEGTKARPCSQKEREALLERFRSTLTVRWLQQVQDALLWQGVGVDASAAAAEQAATAGNGGVGTGGGGPQGAGSQAGESSSRSVQGWVLRLVAATVAGALLCVA